MSSAKARLPYLVKLFQDYLNDEDSASFIQAVSQHYTTATLERLARYGSRIGRRASVLALGFLGGYESNHVLGRALRDPDRGVRLLAENGIRQLWFQAGNEPQRQRLTVVARMIASDEFHRAAQLAGALIDEAPWFAEAWNQRAIAYFHMGRFEDSANDCHQTLELNPYHFGAAVGMAHCYLEMNDAFAALECFRRALKLNPDMEGVRAQVAYLERSLEGS